MESKSPSILDQYLKETEWQTPVMGGRGFLRRWVALILDGFFIYLLGVIVLEPVRVAGFASDPSGILSNFFIVAPWLLRFFYSGFFYQKWSATPGKWLLGLAVRRNDGGHLSFVQGGLRDTVGYLVSSIPLFIGFFMAMFRSDGKGLHDLLFRTRVHRSKSPQL